MLTPKTLSFWTAATTATNIKYGVFHSVAKLT